MRNRALLIGGLVIVLVVGFLMLRREPGLQRIVGTGISVATGSRLAEVRDDVLVVSELRPQHVKPFVDFLLTQWQRVSATALWKRYDVGSFLKQQFEEGFKRDTGDGTPRDSEKELQNFYALMASMHQFFTDMKNGFVIVSRKTFVVKDAVAIPYLLFELSFTSGQIPTAIGKYLDSELLKGKESLTEPNVSVVRSTTATGVRYAIEFRPEGVPPIPSALVVDGGRVEYRLGASEDAAFFVANGSPALVNTDRWKQLAALSQDTDAWQSYVDPAALMQTVNGIFTALGEPLPPLENTGFAVWKEMDGMLITTNLYGGLKGRSCVAVRSGGELEKAYDKLFAARGSERAPHQFRYLLGDRSILGVQLNMTGIAQSLEMIAKYVEQSMAAAEPAQVAELQETVARVQQFINEFGFREVGMLMDGPAGMPLPEGGLYLGSGKVSPTEVLAKLEASLTSMTNQLAPDAGVKISRAKNAAGRELIHIGKEDGGMELIGMALDDGSILFGINELYLDGGAAALRAKKSKLDSFNLKASGLDAILPGSEYYVYLNTEPAFVALRPFLPMVLSQQPGTDVTPGDVEEILNFLSGALVISQKTERQSKEIVCAENVLATLGAAQ